MSRSTWCTAVNAHGPPTVHERELIAAAVDDATIASTPEAVRMYISVMGRAAGQPSAEIGCNVGRIVSVLLDVDGSLLQDKEAEEARRAWNSSQAFSTSLIKIVPMKTVGEFGVRGGFSETRGEQEAGKCTSTLHLAEKKTAQSIQNPEDVVTLHGPDDLHEITQAFLVATADSGTDDTTKPLSELLQNIRALLDMDIAFVAEFVDGRRLFRHVASTPESSALLQVGQCHALEETYCQRIVDGRLPRAIQNSALLPEAVQLEATRSLRIAAYLSAPVVLQSGEIYGTLCCISHQPRTSLGPLQVDALRSVAAMVAKELEKRRESR